MPGLCCNDLYGAMKNYVDVDDDEYKNRNEDRNDDDYATSGSGSYGPSFYPITTPWSCICG